MAALPVPCGDVQDSIAPAVHLCPMHPGFGGIWTYRPGRHAVKDSESSILGLVLAEDLLPDEAVDAIRGHHYVSRGPETVVEREEDLIFFLRNVHQPVPQLDGSRRQRRNQQLLEFSAHGKTTTNRDGVQLLPLRREFKLLPSVGCLLQLRAQAKALQDAGARSETQGTAPDLPGIPGLVELHLNITPSALQGLCQGEAA
mmetsp:Transcript_59413/g.139098  ORF Transcript_59413/g.139098 Transcript_59413/m.139098 type:complete len:200 (-) Transcript_59413:98-697(-)